MITIIIMLILAGIVLSLTIGENGIITRAKEASKKQTEEQVKEEISIMLTDYAVDRNTTGKLLIDYLNEQKDNGKLDVVKDNGDGTYTVEKGGYEITIKNEDLTILEVEQVGLGIKISNIQITTDGSTLAETKSVKVGTPLQINFVHRIEGGTSTVTPSLPYTTNGTEMSKEFVVTGVVNGENYTKTIVISLEDKYKDQMIAETVQVGDFVNYSVGNWTEADIAKIGDLYGGADCDSMTYEKFGGYGVAEGKVTSKDSSIVGPFSKGWRVLSINSNGTIDIIHAGTPEMLYYSARGSYMYQVLASLRDWTMYEDCSTDSSNTNYAVSGSAHCLKDVEIAKTDGNSNLRQLSGKYLCCSAVLSEYCVVGTNGGINGLGCATDGGIRPVVTLKAEIKVKAKNGQTTHITPETAWELEL